MAGSQFAGTVRVRATAVAVAVVGVVLLLGSLGLLAVLRDALTTQLRASIQLRATEVIADLNVGASPALPDNEFELVQVLDGARTVLVSSAAIRGAAPLADLAPGRSAEVAVPVDDRPFLVTATAAETAQGRRIVLVARSLDEVAEPTQAVILALVLGLPRSWPWWA